MKEKMTTEQFLYIYADNLLQALIDGKIGYKYLTIECDFCPLRELCLKDSEENPALIDTCASFFWKSLSDGKVFRK
jgi:hypothetical protein